MGPLSMYRRFGLPGRKRYNSHLFLGWMPSAVLGEFFIRSEQRIVHVLGLGRLTVTWDGRKISDTEANMLTEVVRKWRKNHPSTQQE